MDKKTTPKLFSFKILFAITLIALSVLNSGISTAQTTFRLGYSGAYGMIPISGGMVQNPAGEFVFAGTNASIGGLGDITRIDNAGNIIWAKSYATGFFTQFNDIKNVSAGNGGGYIATGGSSSGGAVLVRVDNAGALLWAYKYQYPDKPGKSSNEYANAVLETSDGGFIVGGSVDYFWDGVSATTVDTSTAFGFKVNSTGALQWNKLWRTPTAAANYDKNYINDVVETTDGYFFVGAVSDVTQADNSNGDKPKRGLIIKTDKATGALTYIRTWGSGTNFTEVNSAKILADGNVLIGGNDTDDGFIAKITGTGATPTVTYAKKIHEVASFVLVKPWIIRNVMQNSDGNYSAIAMRIDPLNMSGFMSTAIIKLNSGGSNTPMIQKTYPGVGPLGASILPKGGLAVSDQGYFAVMTDSDPSAQYIISLFKTDNLGIVNTSPTSCIASTPAPTISNYTITYSTPALTEYTSLIGSVIVPVVANITPTQEIFCLTVPCVAPAVATTVTAAPNPICAGQTSVITASGPATGVTYNVYAAATGGASLGSTPYTTQTLSGNTTYYIETSLNSNPTCVSTTRVAVLVTVNPSPTAISGSNTPVCVGSTLNLTSGGGTSYSWAGPNSFSNTTQNPSIPSVTAAATGTYTVTVTAAGCSATSTVSVVVNSSITPVTGFSYTTPVCANGTNPVPSPVASFTTGGTYSSTSGLTINPGTGVITLSSSTPGTYTVTYSIIASGCTLAGSSTTSITINPIITPVTGFSYTTPVCANGTNPAPTPVASFTTGGTYSSTVGLTINGSTGVIDLTTSTAGTYTVSYTLVASGCTLAGTNTASITINPVITPVTGFSYTTPVCANGTNPVPTPVAGFTTGGTYSSTAGLTINSSTGVITLSSSTPGTYTVTYSVAASGCSLAGNSTTSIVINPVTTPVTGFSYTSPVCVNGTNPVPTPVASFTTGGTYSSTAGLTINSSTGVITLSSSTSGTYIVTYTVAATGCALAGSSTTSITITSVITPVTGFSYTTPVCANGTNPVPTPVTSFTTGGTYSSTVGLTINSSTGVITLSTSTPGTFTVTYSIVASGCTLAGNSTTSITINPSITPVTGFSYTTPICANGTNPVPIPVTSFTAGGTYSSTAGLTINPSTGVINLSTSTPGTYTVSYTLAALGCTLAGNSASSITITPLTTPVTGFSYTTPVCVNGTNPLPIPVSSFVTGGTYSSTTGLTINSTTGVITLSTSTPGTYTVTYSVVAAGCVLAGGSTTTITISPIITPITGFSYNTPVCISGTNPIPVTVANFTNGGIYSSTAGLTINSSTGIVNLSASTPGTYTITYSYAASGCTLAGSSNTTITIDAVPIASAGPDVTITQYTQDTLLASGGGTYQWSPSIGLSCDNCANPIANPSSTTVYCVTVTNASGCSDSSCVTVIVDIVCGDLFVPTAFSPNGDNQNDILYVKSNCIIDMNFAIFDRWGEKVFETNDVNIGWDGTVKGKPLDTAVFAYYLKGTLKGKAIDLHGNITLTK